MYRFWDIIIEPILELLQPGSIVEIGCDQGKNTRNLLEFCNRHGATLYGIDPVPKFDVAAWQEHYGERFIFYQSLSLNTIHRIDKFDVVLIDGDHNWYTVLNELKLIEKRCLDLGQSFPIILLHDIGWPYGRRDLYYNPENIPAPYRKPYKQKGMRPALSELQEKGGLNAHLFNSIYENNMQNGVLTAIEDFIRESKQAMELIKIPGLYGLAVLYPCQLKEQSREFTTFLTNWVVQPFLQRYVERIESFRIEVEIVREESSNALRAKENELLEIKKRMADIEKAFDSLQGEHQQYVTSIRGKENQVAELERRLVDTEKALSKIKVQQREEVERLQSDLQHYNTALQGKETEVAQLKQRLSEAEKVVSEKDRQLSVLQNTLNKRNQDIENLVGLIEQMNTGISAILKSQRWKVGNVIGELQRRVLFKSRIPMASDHLNKLEKRFQAWKTNSQSLLLNIKNKHVDHSTLPNKQNVRITPDDLSFYQKVSVISAVYNKSSSLIEYAKAFAEQTYPGEIEIILVDDLSTDGSLDVIQCLSEIFISRKDTFQVKLIRNQKNIGNCGSRNRGLQYAEGEILIVIDADCIVNRFFVEEHVKAHSNSFDVCIGPMGIESKERDIGSLYEIFAVDESLVYKEMRLQYPSEPTSFMNCVTRNFSVTKSFLNNLEEPLFDESFSYSKEPGSGFGWEDIEMGYRLYNKGARIWFAPKAISIHKTHDPEIPDSDKPQRSMKNFAKLLRKHPQIVTIAPDWTKETYDKIMRWLDKYGYGNNEDSSFVKALFQTSKINIPLRNAKGDK